MIMLSFNLIQNIVLAFSWLCECSHKTFLFVHIIFFLNFNEHSKVLWSLSKDLSSKTVDLPNYSTLPILLIQMIMHEIINFLYLWFNTAVFLTYEVLWFEIIFMNDKANSASVTHMLVYSHVHLLAAVIKVNEITWPWCGTFLLNFSNTFTVMPTKKQLYLGICCKHQFSKTNYLRQK